MTVEAFIQEKSSSAELFEHKTLVNKDIGILKVSSNDSRKGFSLFNVGIFSLQVEHIDCGEFFDGYVGISLGNLDNTKTDPGDFPIDSLVARVKPVPSSSSGTSGGSKGFFKILLIILLIVFVIGVIAAAAYLLYQKQAAKNQQKGGKGLTSGGEKSSLTGQDTYINIEDTQDPTLSDATDRSSRIAKDGL